MKIGPTMCHAEIMRKLCRLVSELSPENLFCDGEISHAAGMKKRNQLMKQWNECEKELGHKISESEVWDFYFAQQ